MVASPSRLPVCRSTFFREDRFIKMRELSAMTKALGLFCQPLPKDFAHFSTVVSAEVGVGASVMAML